MAHLAAARGHVAGPAPSPDNVVVHFPARCLLFGGCMFKAGSSIGNTANADLGHWESALRRLRDAGLLAQKGRGSATYYLPTERLKDQTEDPEGLSRESAPLLSRELEGLSRESAPFSRELEGLAGESNGLQEARRALLAALPGELAARLGALGRRSPPADVRAVVLDLLRQCDWRLEDLATLLLRNPEYVRQKYVQPLLQQGLITMTRPEAPNDPQQAYRATG